MTISTPASRSAATAAVGVGGHRGTDAGLVLVPAGGPGRPVDPAHTEDEKVEPQLLHDLDGEGAGLLVGLRTGDPTKGDAPDRRAQDQLGGDVEGVGDDGCGLPRRAGGDVGAGHEVAGRGRGGRAAVEADHPPDLDQLCRLVGDALAGGSGRAAL